MSYHNDPYRVDYLKIYLKQVKAEKNTEALPCFSLL